MEVLTFLGGDVSGLHAALSVQLPRWGNQFGIAAPINVYPCTNGTVYAGILLDSHWRLLTELIERTDLGYDDKAVASLIEAGAISPTSTD